MDLNRITRNHILYQQRTEVVKYTTSQLRRVLLSYFSYFSTGIIFFLTFFGFFIYCRRIRFGIKNVVFLLLILYTDMMVSEHFKKATYISMNLVDSTPILTIAYALGMMIITILATTAYVCLFDYFYDLKDEETQDVPAYMIPAGYSIIWYSYYTLLNLTLFLFDFIFMIFQSQPIVSTLKRISDKINDDFTI
ncbi:hypothetical protein PRIPAC_96912 [Pristionchus pacificus]|uniref:Uncharacterized protein n=1 Tax=Pristionchus pacificus TaxID=54126 RepID=A0A2A6CUB5_PRIPA|nr:hypothetical protein PRIPAC_96912 [Pristionchus pacificus]|eukprot:PDM81633.1 hypothetical protein PRIPAC_30614 [Pristionchus pacificus]